jgi:hypothetical protein
MPTGRVGHARFSRRVCQTAKLPFERKASPFCIGRAIILNGRISCFASLPSLPQRGLSAKVRLRFEPDQTQLSIAYPCAFRSR